jgi:hypothetical protein
MVPTAVHNSEPANSDWNDLDGKIKLTVRLDNCTVVLNECRHAMPTTFLRDRFRRMAVDRNSAAPIRLHRKTTANGTNVVVTPNSIKS